MAIDEVAASIMRDGNNCAQSVLIACGESLGLPRETAQQLALTLGGGAGRSGNICGAVSGGLMALGLSFPASDIREKATKDAAIKLAQDFLARFRAQHGAINCRELIGFDISTPEGYQQAAAAGVFKSTCPALAGSAARIVELLIAGKAADGERPTA